MDKSNTNKDNPILQKSPLLGEFGVQNKYYCSWITEEFIYVHKKAVLIQMKRISSPTQLHDIFLKNLWNLEIINQSRVVLESSMKTQPFVEQQCMLSLERPFSMRFLFKLLDVELSGKFVRIAFNESILDLYEKDAFAEGRLYNKTGMIINPEWTNSMQRILYENIRSGGLPRRNFLLLISSIQLLPTSGNIHFIGVIKKTIPSMRKSILMYSME